MKDLGEKLREITGEKMDHYINIDFDGFTKFRVLTDVFFNRPFAHGDRFYWFGETVFEDGDQLTVRGLFRNAEQTAHPFPRPRAVGE